MDFDLQRGLRGLGSEPPATAAVLPVDDLVRRAHRRRAARMTAFSAVGATAAGALVLGGVAITGHLGPAPVPPVIVPTQTSAAPTPPPSPTPSSTATATDTPYSPDLSWCGHVFTYDDQASTGPSTSYVYSTDSTDNAVGGPITAALQVGTDSMQVGDRVGLTVLDALLTTYDPMKDAYTVVGVPAASLPSAAARQFDAPPGENGSVGTELSLRLTSPYVMCDGRPGAGGPPTEAEYDVWAHVELVRGDATLTAWGHATVRVGNPPAWQPPAPAPGDPSTLPPVDVAWLRQSLGLPGCGDSFPTDTTPSTPDWWSIDATAALEGTGIRVDVTGTRVGAGIDGAALGPIVSITKDGVVVAQSQAGHEVPWIIGTLPVGASVTKTVVIDATCVALGADHPVGSALPPGTYQVWAEEEIGDATVVDGVAQGGWGRHRGGPWQLVVP